VTNASRFDLDQHLTGARPFELNVCDRERLARLERNRCSHFHSDIPLLRA
jgi:hypothetical protein